MLQSQKVHLCNLELMSTSLTIIINIKWISEVIQVYSFTTTSFFIHYFVSPNHIIYDIPVQFLPIKRILSSHDNNNITDDMFT